MHGLIGVGVGDLENWRRLARVRVRGGRPAQGQPSIRPCLVLPPQARISRAGTRTRPRFGMPRQRTPPGCRPLPLDPSAGEAPDVPASQDVVDGAPRAGAALLVGLHRPDRHHRQGYPGHCPAFLSQSGTPRRTMPMAWLLIVPSHPDRRHKARAGDLRPWSGPGRGVEDQSEVRNPGRSPCEPWSSMNRCTGTLHLVADACIGAGLEAAFDATGRPGGAQAAPAVLGRCRPDGRRRSDPRSTA